ncbi:peptide deformylase [Candidatus Omnitrophota bacterium]
MKETGLRIRIYGDPCLRRRARPVASVTDEHRRNLSEMARLMYDGSGIGLAATQVGLDDSMIVVDIGEGLYKLVNPKVTERSGRQVNQEGCLSVPDVCLDVRRAANVTVEAMDENGKEVKIDTEGFFACVLQHEIDHLKGKVIVDYASFFDKFKLKKKLAGLKKRAQNEGLPEQKTKSCKLQL